MGMLLVGSALPSMAGDRLEINGIARTTVNSVAGVRTVGNRATGSGVAVTIPGYGNGNPALVAARADFSGRRADFSHRDGAFPNRDGACVRTVGNRATGSGVAVTIPGYGNGNPALVAARADFSGRRADFSHRDGVGNWGDQNRGRSRNNNDNANIVVVFPDTGLYGNYNNGNYLGLPPWYRLNYYTPTLDDQANGTAYQNIPSSHAWRGYGIPDGYPGTTTYGMPNQATNLPAGYQQPAADVDFVVAVQRELRRRGFYRGIVNGISDASTRAAIRAFEASAGLPVTGVIGVPLLQTLGFF